MAVRQGRVVTRAEETLDDLVGLVAELASVLDGVLDIAEDVEDMGSERLLVARANRMVESYWQNYTIVTEDSE